MVWLQTLLRKPALQVHFLIKCGRGLGVGTVTWSHFFLLPLALSLDDLPWETRGDGSLESTGRGQAVRLCRVRPSRLSTRMRWPKDWSFRFSVVPSKEIPGLISFRMDWLALLAVQGTLKSLLQHHGSKASILRRSAFLTVQLSHPYLITGKTIALTRQTFVGKVMALFFNMIISWS